MSSRPLTLSQIKLYNPHEQTDEQIQKLFVARQKQFQYLLDSIGREGADSIPQHHLIIGQRGMGKTTMLKRIEVELRIGSLSERFIPILMPEELYDLRSLSRFLLTCLDRLADSLEIDGDQAQVESIDQQLNALRQLSSEEKIINQSFAVLLKIADSLGRRPIILVDNVAFVFAVLSTEEQHKLRALLMKNSAPILIGANARTIEASSAYEAPFYDAFKMLYLKKLKFSELEAIIINLAKITGAKSIQKDLVEQKGRLRSLHQLTGGNPRTITMLFRLVSKGFANDIQDDLNAILDEVTPLYKDRFENLSEQMRRIVMSVAMHWDPIKTEQLRSDTALENKQLSPQLRRLLDSGWIMTEEEGIKKDRSYSMSERLFNIWILMRQGSRREKKALYGLSRFLDLYYGEYLSMMAKARLGMHYQDVDQVNFNIAIANTIKDASTRSQLLVESNYAKIKFVEDEAGTYGANKQADPCIIRGLKCFNSQKYDESEKSFLRAIENNPNDIFSAYLLGVIYQYHIVDYEKAVEFYFRALEINSSFIGALLGLGEIYQYYLLDYNKSEEYFQRASELDTSSALPLLGLGNLYHYHIKNYKKSEEYYLQAIKQDSLNIASLTALGSLYQYHLTDYDKAENYYQRAIEIEPSNVVLITDLGNLYHDYLGDFDKAAKAYQKALVIDPSYDVIRFNLVFLLRDQIEDHDKAKNIFHQISQQPNDTYHLHESLFALYDQNLGIAKDRLHAALSFINVGFSPETQDDWCRYGAVTHKLGFTTWLLAVLRENGMDVVLSPYYIALEALLADDPESHFRTVAIEKRPAANDILLKMNQYINDETTKTKKEQRSTTSVR